MPKHTMLQRESPLVNDWLAIFSGHSGFQLDATALDTSRACTNPHMLACKSEDSNVCPDVVIAKPDAAKHGVNIHCNGMSCALHLHWPEGEVDGMAIVACGRR